MAVSPQDRRERFVGAVVVNNGPFQVLQSFLHFQAKYFSGRSRPGQDQIRAIVSLSLALCTFGKEGSTGREKS